MRKIKAFLLSSLAVILGAFCLLSCGADTGIAGTYYFSHVTTTTSEGEIVLVYAGDEYEGVVFSEDMMTITLEEDGTLTLSYHFDGASESVHGVWRKGEGDVVLLSGEGASFMEVEVKEGRLTLDFETGFLVLERE